MEFDKINAGRYLAKVRSRIDFSKYSAQKNPTVVILGGQPAAGKTSVIEDIQKRFGGNIISINGDDFREVVPVYNKLKKRNPELAVKLSQPYTNYIVDNLLREASDKKLNIIVEGTMRNSGVPLNTASTLKLKGYKIEGIVLTAHELQSRSGLMFRYESELKSKGYGRAVSLESHNEAYNNIPETVRALENSEIFDKISLYNRDAELLAFKEYGNISDLADIYEKKGNSCAKKTLRHFRPKSNG